MTHPDILHPELLATELMAPEEVQGLGQLAVPLAVTEPTGEHVAPSVATHGDFMTYADQNSIRRMSMGMAWNRLFELFYMKHCGDSAVLYQHIPLAFYGLDVATDTSWQTWSRHSSTASLDVSSLSAFIDLIDTTAATSRVSTKLAIKKVINGQPYFSEHVYRLWKGFAETYSPGTAVSG